jgi:hypothetical protein
MNQKAKIHMLMSIRLLILGVVMAVVIFLAVDYYNVRINPRYAIDYGYDYHIAGEIGSSLQGVSLQGVRVSVALMDDSFEEWRFGPIGTTDGRGYFAAGGLYLWGTGGRSSGNLKFPKYFCIKIGDKESSLVETILRIPISSLRPEKGKPVNIYLGKIVLPWKDAITSDSKALYESRNDNVNQRTLENTR